MSQNTISLLIQGSRPKRINFQNGDTLADLIRDLRANYPDIPADKVQKWHVDSKVIANPSDLALQAGMVVSGAPKLEGGY